MSGKPDELPGAVRRMVASLLRRSALGDDDALRAIVELRAMTRDAVVDGADRLHGAGYSWADIGAILGVTRQGAHQQSARARAKRHETAG